jgi:hypothetical protein
LQERRTFRSTPNSGERENRHTGGMFFRAIKLVRRGSARGSAAYTCLFPFPYYLSPPVSWILPFSLPQFEHDNKAS